MAYWNTHLNEVNACPGYPTGRQYIVAGNHAASYVWKKLAASGSYCNGQMPPGNPGYGQNMIRDWIDEGAQTAN
jgi:hypothetical protein